MESFLSKLRRRLAGQDGFALVMVLGVSVVLGIGGTTAMIYTTRNEGSAARAKADTGALSLAEAGLNNAYAVLYNASDPTQPGAVPQRSDQLEAGTATYYGTLDAQQNVWTLTGVGRLASPVRGTDIVRTVHGRVRLGTGQASSQNNAVWNYVYADSTTTCTTLPNSVNLNVPLYVKGDLCLQNSAQVSGANTVLQVGGTVTINNSATIGSAGSPLAQAHIVGGCRIGNGALHSPCSATDRVYASTIDTQTTGLTKPPVDLLYWYQNAQPGPLHGCTTGSFPGGFDNDTVMNRSLTQAVDLTPYLPYDCQVLDAKGNLVGRIAWAPSTGTLTIAGTIFFDGDIVFRNLVNAVYVGRATVYASGTITVKNQSTLCGIAGCTAGWDPLQNLLAFVAGSSTDAIGFSIENNSVFQGAIYAVNDYNEGNAAVLWGPIVARQVYLQNSTNHYVPLGALLPGMPASYQEVVTLSNEPAGYS